MGGFRSLGCALEGDYRTSVFPALFSFLIPSCHKLSSLFYHTFLNVMFCVRDPKATESTDHGLKPPKL